MALVRADLRDPGRVAAELGEANARLGRSAEAAPDVLELVESMSATLSDQDDTFLEGVDPYLVIALQKAALGAERALHEDEPNRRRVLRLRLEQMRHVFRDLAGELEVSDQRSGKELARWLTETVDLPQQRLADLLGVEKRTFQRWISEKEPSSPAADDESRLRIVARLVNQLRHSLTPVGVIGWFERPRSELAGQAPRDLLSEPDALPRIQALAAGLRSSTAS